MGSDSRLADYTCRDLEHLHAIHQSLEALAGALASTNLQAKPALLALIGDADGRVLGLARKAAPGMLRRAAKGQYSRRTFSEAFEVFVSELGARP